MKRRMIPAAALLLLAGTLAACDAPSVRTDIDPSKITYTQDARTNLCFAVLGRGAVGELGVRANSFSMTNVPCSDAVLRQVRR
jgi:hypothetical protein